MLAISAARFISGIAFVIAGARTGRAAPPPTAVVETTPVASIAQIMNAITAPAATAVYAAVGTVVSARGIEETAPRNDEEWALLASRAAALAESGNLLLLDGRAIDRGDWVTMTRAMIEWADKAVTAAEAKSASGILEAGSEINTTCDNCHAKYQRQ
jgi:hypothetical protein